MIKSGIYGFFQRDYDSNGTLILNVGKCENKKERTKTYRGTNAQINFHYFKEVPVNQISIAEEIIKTKLKNLGYKQWGNSTEQFIVDDESVTRQLLSEHMSLSVIKNCKNIDYEFGTLDEHTIGGPKVIKDIRDDILNCAFIPRLLAMLTTAVGLDQSIRYVKTWFVPKGNKIIKTHNITSVPISKEGWDVWQCGFKTAMETKKVKGPF